MPFVFCDCSSRVVLLDPNHPYHPICARCQQPMELVSSQGWLRIAERRQQELATIVQQSRELVRTSRELRETCLGLHRGTDEPNRQG
jgi:hypothetical protein